MNKKYIYIILMLIVLVGAIVFKIKGFNKELIYSNRQEFIFSAPSTLEEKKIKEIAEQSLKDKKVVVQKVERFENAIAISSTEISEEEKENIINKINEEYNENISNDEIEIINISEVKVRDILKKYVIPIAITLIVILAYFIVIYNKLGIKQVIIKTLLFPVLLELAYYSIIAITRVPFGRLTNSIAIGLYILSIGVVSFNFRTEKDKLNLNQTEKENDD